MSSMPKMVRRWWFAAARTCLNWRPVLGAITVCERDVSMIACLLVCWIVGKRRETFSSNIRSPYRLPRIFARERKPDELLDHLLIAAAILGFAI